MKNNKYLIWGCILLGLLLLASCVLLVLHNFREDRAAAQNAQQILEALETAVTDPTEPEIQAVQEPAAPTGPTQPPEPTDPPDPASLVSEFLDGHEYVGYLLFPSLDRRLPVMKIAYLEDLQIAPCLEKGSPLTDDAVISAHNYPSHFGPIRDWTGGEEVIFTTLEGQDIHYTVTLVQTIEPEDVEMVMESEHDLVLYTCTTGGKHRVMIACDRTE